MKFELFVAKRYLLGRKKVSFISTILFISIAGVFLGTTVLILTLSVMNGFETEVKKRIMGSFAHVKVQSFRRDAITSPDSLAAVVCSVPGVAAAAPLIEDKAGISGREARDAVILKGVDIAKEATVTDLSKNIKLGTLNLEMALSKKGRQNPGIVLGSYVADKLRVMPGDEVIVMSLRGEEDAIAGVLPKMKRLTVTGFYESGMYEYDANLAFTSLTTAADLFELSGAMALEVRVHHPEEAALVSEAIREKLGYPWDAIDWMRQYGTLIKWMNTEKLVAFVVICMIIMVAIFNIISSLLMVVMEKTGEIGILLSMGATPKHIRRIFLYDGLFVGLVGSSLGLVVGLGLCFLQIHFHFIHLPADVYFLDTLPMRVAWLDVVAVVVTTNLLCLLFSLYPSRKAAKLKPVDALKYI